MQERLINRLTWGGLAALAGGLVAISPFWLAALGAACLGLVAIASITPLVALHATLALAPLRALLSRAGSWPLPLDIGQTAFALLLAIWLAHGIRQKRLHLPAHWRRALTPLALFVFALLLHGLAVGATAAWLREWLKWLALLLTALLTLSLCTRYGWAGALSAILLAAAANAILGVLQFSGFVESATHLQIDARFTRAYGSYEQPNPFAGLMGMTAPLAALAALGYSVRAWQRRRDPLPWRNGLQCSAAVACAACAILLAAALFMSWSRGAWLGGIGAALAVIAAIPRRRWASLLALSLSIALLAGIWLTGALPPSLDARLRNVVLELISLRDVRGVDFDAGNYALVERVAHWQAALRMAEARPWLGVGLGGYENAYSEYRLVNWPESLGHAHNFYLNMLAETGVFGLAAYLALCVALLWRSWRARAHPDSLARYLAIGVFAAWVYFCLHSLSDNLYVNNSFLILGTMLGLMLHIYSQIQPRRLT